MKDEKEIIVVSESFATVCINFLVKETKKAKPKSDLVIMTGMVLGFLECFHRSLDEEFHHVRDIMHKIDDVLFNFLFNKDKE